MTEEQDGASTHSTASKRDVVFAWLDEHHELGMTVDAVAKGAGVAHDTAKKWFGLWVAHRARQWQRVLDDDEPAADADDADDEGAAEQVDAVDEDNVTVARVYLLTLEALRDQVLETQRLRRALEAR